MSYESMKKTESFNDTKVQRKGREEFECMQINQTYSKIDETQ